MLYVSLLDMSNKGIFLVANRDGSIMGFETFNKGLEYYEAGYRSSRGLGYEGAMSALINSITFNPSIVQFESLEEIVEKLFNGKSEAKLVSVSHVSGFVTAIEIANQENARTLWDSGVKPRMS
jgi:NAD/NADP transhydrogenase beta subunit